MIQDVITIALVCNEEVMLIHAYISSLKGEVLRGDDKHMRPSVCMPTRKTTHRIGLLVGMVGAENFEISTCRLKAGYSASELRTLRFMTFLRFSFHDNSFLISFL